MSAEPEIYCPRCSFRPGAEDRWVCEPGCGTQWNTFWTHGVCPGCGHAWQDTRCPACGQTSPHEDWYHYPGDGELSESEVEELVADA